MENMKGLKKAVIFDLDGTLIHSLPDISDSVNVMLREFGFPERTEKEVMKFIGNGARKLIERAIGENDNQKLIDECLDYYNKVYSLSGSPKTGLFDGIESVLLELKARGYLLAILTNKPQITTNEVYKTYLEKFKFDMVVGQSDKVKCKPDKEAVLHILDVLGVDVKNACFVGDGETDVMLSINAKMRGVAVLWGYREREVLAEYGAKEFVEKPQELLELLV